MPLILAPFLFLGLGAKIANRRYKKRFSLAVQSKNEPQLNIIVALIATRIGSINIEKEWGSINDDRAFEATQERAIESRYR